RRIRREATNGPLLTVEEDFCAPDETAIRSLAEGDIAVCNIDPAQVPLRLPLDHDFWCVCIAHAHVNAMGVTQVDERGGTPEVSDRADATWYNVTDTVVLRSDFVVHARRQGHVLLARQEITHLDPIPA